MATEEVLKQLLETFSEKETLVLEELNVVVDEIAKLEAKIAVCQSRLSTITGDRQRVLSMRDRYLCGDFTTAAASVALAESQAGQAGGAADQAPKAAYAAPAEPVAQSAAGFSEPPLAAPAATQPAVADPLSASLATTMPIPTDKAYPPPADAQPDLAQAQSATPLQELRKRFGLSNLLGSKKSADGKQADVPPPAPWEDGAALTAGSATAFDTAAFAGANQANNTGAASGASPAPPVTPPPSPAANEQSPDKESAAPESADKDNDTVKSINDALRSLFR